MIGMVEKYVLMVHREVEEEVSRVEPRRREVISQTGTVRIDFQ